jgi:uncharacterized MAPEG superfamily protein
MSTAIWMLLAFAAWTILLLISTIGVYRWSRILTGQAPINGFNANPVDGADWYRRSMRAHTNCIENLPVFASIVFAIYVTQLNRPAVGYLCIGVMVARVLQSLVHVVLPQTPLVATWRFALYFVQIVCFLSLVVLVIAHAAFNQ